MSESFKELYIITLRALLYGSIAFTFKNRVIVIKPSNNGEIITGRILENNLHSHFVEIIACVLTIHLVALAVFRGCIFI